MQLPPITLSFTDYEGRLTEARARLGQAAFEEAWEEGEAMTEEEAAGYALAAAEKTPAALTGREHEIATLVARGLTNRRMAEELHLSERTVATHVGRILKKLSLRSRDQVGPALRRSGLG